MNILLIDDDRDTTFLVDLLLKKIPFIEDYHIKLGAHAGLEFLSGYDKPLSCIFVDVKMPEMDGFQFAQAYQNKYYDKFPETRVYFLTSSARQSDREKAFRFPFVKDFLLKPLTKKQVFEIYEDVARHPFEEKKH